MQTWSVQSVATFFLDRRRPLYFSLLLSVFSVCLFQESTQIGMDGKGKDVVVVVVVVLSVCRTCRACSTLPALLKVGTHLVLRALFTVPSTNVAFCADCLLQPGSHRKLASACLPQVRCFLLLLLLLLASCVRACFLPSAARLPLPVLCRIRRKGLRRYLPTCLPTWDGMLLRQVRNLRLPLATVI